MNTPKLVVDWRSQLQRPSVLFHIAGIILSGIGVGVASIYGSLDPIQHAQLPPASTCFIFLVIFIASIAGRFFSK